MDFDYDSGTISSILTLEPNPLNNLTVQSTRGLVLPVGPNSARIDTIGALRFNSDLSYLEYYNGTSWVPVSFSGNTLQQDNTIALSNLNGTGLLVQTAAGTFVERSVVGTAGDIVVTNGSGVAGNMTIDLATAGTAGTYVLVTTDSFGRVTSGATTQDWLTITGLPSTLVGYGITNAITNSGNVASESAGTLSNRPAATVATGFYYATDTGATYYSNGATWALTAPALTGDITSSANGTTTTLANVNLDVGTFGSVTQIPVLTVNAKGLVTAVSNVSISGAISVTGGDLTLSGTTGTAITNAQLATVNGNTGFFGSNNQVATFTVDAKGRTTSAGNVTITPTAIGAIAATELGAINGVATLDINGTLTSSQIPAALLGGMQFAGTWNATTGDTTSVLVPTITYTSNVAPQGQYFVVATAGTTTINTLVGNVNQWNPGDIIISTGSAWEAIDGLSTEVTSVFGRVGAITANLASSDFANQGTTTTVLHGNANGAPSWGAINLASDVTGTLPASTFPALTGDVTTLAGSVNTTLATVNGNVGTFGSTTTVPIVTVNAKGLVTGVSTATISGVISVTGGDLTLSGSTGTAITNAQLATVNADIGTYGSTTQIPVITVNAKGLVTSVNTASISGAITVIGDATGTGTTGGNTAITLATVNSSVGQFGDATHVPQFTVNAKGLVTAVGNVAITASGIGAVANAGNAPSIQEGTFAARPAAGTLGAIYITTDSTGINANSIYRDNGAAWVQIGEAGVLYNENPNAPVANSIAGINAVAIGTNLTANGNVSLATGSGASTSLYGADVRAAGNFAAPGDAQSGRYILRVATTGITQTEAFLDGSSARLILPNNTGWSYVARIVAQGQAGSSGGWTISGVVARGASASATALVGNRSKAVLTRPAGWDCEVSADATNGALAFKVTGASATNIRWVITVETTEATY